MKDKIIWDPGTTPAFRGAWGFLSNFTPVEVEFEGDVYPSVEHAFVASRTEDRGLRARIRETRTAAEAKRIGREHGLKRAARDVSIMETLLRQKFAHTRLREWLLATGDQEIVERNTWGDTFWGTCWNEPKQRFEGANTLGRLLMKVRAELEPIACR